MFRRAYPEAAATLGSWDGKPPTPEVYRVLRESVLRRHPGKAGLGLEGRKGPRLLRCRVEVGESLPPLSLPQAGADGSAPAERAARARDREELRLPPASPSRSRSRAKKPSSRKKKK